MNEVDALSKARELVASGWTQGEAARSSDGEAVLPYSPAACAWCMLGSLQAVGAPDAALELLFEAAVAKSLGMTAGRRAKILAAWNDDADRTKEEVQAAFDKAIEEAA